MFNVWGAGKEQIKNEAVELNMIDVKKLKRTKRADQNHKVLVLTRAFRIQSQILPQIIKLKQKRDSYE